MEPHRNTNQKYLEYVCLVWLMLFVSFLSSCDGSDKIWQTKNITGLMPPLEFTLTSANSHATVQADDYHGHVLLMYFGYMHCPDVCPMTLGRLQNAISRLGEAGKQVRILFVSVDPKRDSLHELAQYTTAFGSQVVGLRGSQAALRELTKRYRVTYGYNKPDREGNYNVSHSSAVYVFDRQGQARLLIRQDDGVGAISHDLRLLLAGTN